MSGTYIRDAPETMSEDSGEESEDSCEANFVSEPTNAAIPSIDEIEALHDQQTAALENPEFDSELPMVSFENHVL